AHVDDQPLERQHARHDHHERLPQREVRDARHDHDHRERDLHDGAATIAPALSCGAEARNFKSGCFSSACRSAQSSGKSTSGCPSRSCTVWRLPSQSNAFGSKALPTTQRACVNGKRSMRMLAPYSCSMRYCSTSNCSAPTTPTMGSFMPICSCWKIWMVPSSLSCSSPFSTCL